MNGNARVQLHNSFRYCFEDWTFSVLGLLNQEFSQQMFTEIPSYKWCYNKGSPVVKNIILFLEINLVGYLIMKVYVIHFFFYFYLLGTMQILDLFYLKSVSFKKILKKIGSSENSQKRPRWFHWFQWGRFCDFLDEPNSQVRS